MRQKRTQRSFTASNILDLIDGARTIEGFDHKQIGRMRALLGLGKDKAPPTAESLSLMKKIAAFGWCPHRWGLQSAHALPGTDTTEAQVFASVQVRHCPKCGATQTRMWTTAGYATKWTYPELPINREVQ